MIDIKSFLEKKEKGLARVLDRTDENIVVALKQYDLEKATLGEIVELPEEVAIQNIQELIDLKLSLQLKIDNINTFLEQ